MTSMGVWVLFFTAIYLLVAIHECKKKKAVRFVLNAISFESHNNNNMYCNTTQINVGKNKLNVSKRCND